MSSGSHNLYIAMDDGTLHIINIKLTAEASWTILFKQECLSFQITYGKVEGT